MSVIISLSLIGIFFSKRRIKKNPSRITEYENGKIKTQIWYTKRCKKFIELQVARKILSDTIIINSIETCYYSNGNKRWLDEIKSKYFSEFLEVTTDKNVVYYNRRGKKI